MILVYSFIQSVSHKFEELARNKLVRYFGNVEVGRDVSIGEMKKFYDAIVLAYGADTDRILGIPGEKEHSYSAKCVSHMQFLICTVFCLFNH
jgi:NADPH-dependent glutamate synthase beta subunit-like oxidoreductase